MTLPEMLDVLAKFGTPLVVTGIVLYGAIRYMNFRFGKLEGKRSLPCMERHHFFSVMQRALTVTIPQLAVNEPGRELLTKDFLRFKVEVFGSRMLEFVKRPELNEYPPEAFSALISEVLSNCIAEYEEKARREKMPDIFIRKFSEWHKQTVDMTLAFVDAIGTCEAQYHENHERLAAVLSWLEVAFQWTFIDAERTIESLNGDLDGLTYRGITLGKSL